MKDRIKRDILTTARNVLAMKNDEHVLLRFDEGDWIMLKILTQKLSRPTYMKEMQQRS